MRREIAAYHRALHKRYVRSKRHTIQVDFLEHLAELKKERKAGAARNGARASCPPRRRSPRPSEPGPLRRSRRRGAAAGE